MKNVVRDYVDRFLHERQAKIKLARILIILGLVVAIAVFWELRFTGIALTNETNCGKEEHTHTEECYEEVLVCGQTESSGHVHTDACYDTETVLTCGQEESPSTPAVEGHTHTDSCYTTNTYTNLICGQEEGEGHTHTDDCYETVTETVLTCGKEESPSTPAVEGHTHTDACYETQTVLVCGYNEGDPDGGHVHTDACYEKQLVCGKEEHTHSVACMSDDTADVETASVWESTLPGHLTGIWADDLILVARSQLGYTESTANYTVTESGDKKGYTRYGAWYGDPYGDWCAMFVSFCLNYAGIGTDVMPRNSGCYAWTVDLSNRGMYASSSGYTPKVGDIVFFDWTGDGRSNHVGIVEEVTYRTADGRTLSEEEAGNVYVDENGRTVIDVDTEVEVEVELEVDPDAAEEEEIEEIEEETDAAAEEEIEIEYFEEDAAEDVDEEDIVLEETEAEDAEEADEGEIEEEADEDRDDAVDEDDIEPATETVIETQTDTVEVYATGIKTIEGNASNMVKEKSYDAGSGNILGYGILPQQSENQIEEAILEPEEEEEASTEETGEIEDDVDSIEVIDDGIEALDDEEDINDEVSISTLSNEVSHYNESDEASAGLVADSAVTTRSGEIMPLGSETQPDGYVTGDDNNVVIEDVTNTTDANYNEDSMDYDGRLRFDFAVNSDDLDENNEVSFTLPSGITPPSDINSLENSGIGWCGDVEAFDFWFTQNADGTWTVHLHFYEGFIMEHWEECWMEIHAHFDADYVDDEGNLHFDFDDEYGFDIPIAPDQNATSGGDIHIEKGVTSEYDPETGSITYTIIVSSNLGNQGGITLEDIIETTGIDVIGVGDVTVNGAAAGSWSYTYDSDTGKLVINLPSLEAGGQYTITYTVYFDDTSISLGTSDVYNEVTGSTYDEWDNPLQDTDKADATIKADFVSKSGELSEDGTYITWTITVNADGRNIAGLTLSDILKIGNNNGDAFEFTSDNCTITGASGGYSIENGQIVFSGTDANGENHNTYTITYVTEVEVEAGSSIIYENDAILKRDDEEIDRDDAEIGVNDDTVDIEKHHVSTNFDEGTAAFEWDTTVTIKNGISAGTVLGDYLSDVDYYNGEWSDYTSITDQWFTYEQITELLGGWLTEITFTDGTKISSDNYTIRIYDRTANTWVSYDQLDPTHTYTAWEVTFNNDVVLGEGTYTLEFTYQSTGNTELLGTPTSEGGYGNSHAYHNLSRIGSKTAHAEVYESVPIIKTDGDGNQSDSSTKVSYDEITGDVTLNWQIKVFVDETWVLNQYQITDILPSGVTITGISVATQNDDGHNWEDWSGTLSKTGTSASGETWSGHMYLYGTDETEVTATVTTVTDADGTTHQELVISIPDEVVAELEEHEGGYFVVNVTVTVDDELLATLFDEEGNPIEDASLDFTNTAKLNGENDVEQKQTIYPRDEEEPGDEDHQVVQKGENWDTINKLLNYSVLINPDGKDLLPNAEGEDDVLTFTDVVTQNLYWENYGFDGYDIYLTLLQNSVQFYQVYNMELDASGTYTYTDESGVTHSWTPGESVPSDVYVAYNNTGEITGVYYKVPVSIAWSYEETDDYNEWTGYTYDRYYTITATLPDSTPLLFEYTYQVNWTGSDDDIADKTLQLTNQATLHGETDYSDSDSHQEAVGDVEASAGTEAGTIKIYKVEEGDYGTLLTNTTFELYIYQDGQWVDTGIEYSTEDIGSFTIDSSSMIDENGKDWFATNTAYYLVETSVPNPYIMDAAQQIFFYWSSEESTSSMPPDFLTDTAKYNAIDVTDYNRVVYVENRLGPTDVEIHKAWQDESGKDISDTSSDIPDSITVDLYRYAVKGEQVSNPEIGSGTTPETDQYPEYVGSYEITKEDGWSLTVEYLAHYFIDEDGYLWTYYYYFVETDVLNGWTTGYGYEDDSSDYGYVGWTGDGEGANGSVNNTIINTSSEKFELPKAGGMGTRRFTLIGLLLVTAAGAGVLLFWDNRRKRGCER